MDSNNGNNNLAIEALLRLQQDESNNADMPADMAYAYQMQIQQQLLASHFRAQQALAYTPHNPNRSLLGPKQMKQNENTMHQNQNTGNLNLSSVENDENIARAMDYIHNGIISPPPSLSPTSSAETSEYSFQNREKFVNLKDKSNKLPESQNTLQSPKIFNEAEVEMENPLLPPKMPGWHGSSIFDKLPDAVQQEFDMIMRESYYVKKESLEKRNREMNDDPSPVRKRGPKGEGRDKVNEASKRSRERKKYLSQVLQNSLDYDLDENYMLYKQEKWLIGIIKNLERKFLQNAPENRGIITILRRECGFER